MVNRAGKRILTFLQRRGVITVATAPGDGEVNVVSDGNAGEADPLLAKLLAAATAGAHKRKPVLMVLDPDDQPVAKGTLCATTARFNLHAATRVAANDKAGRERLCRYILRPPFANDRLSLLPNGNARLELKRLHAAILRSQVVPAPAKPADAPAQDKPATRSRYIPWAKLLRRTFAIDVVCSRCQSRLRFIALIKSEPTARKILTAMPLPTEIPELHPARPPPGAPAWGNGDHDASDDWLN